MDKPIVVHPDTKPEVSLYKPIDRLYTVKEAADVLRAGDQIVRKLIASGHLRALKLGGLKVRGSELERFMEAAEGFDFSEVDSPKPLRR